MKIRVPVLTFALLLLPALAAAHCEVPCGIYDDELRMTMLAEHATTIEKAMAQIEALGGSGAADHDPNQIVRWVTTKDDHATQAQHIVSQYFMTQRIKPDAENAVAALQSLHRMLIAAMKCKQTTDPAHVAALRAELETFRQIYFTDHPH